MVAAVLIGGGITGGAVNPDRAAGLAIMSGTSTALWVYVLAEIVGAVAAALPYTHVVIKSTAPTMEKSDPQAAKSTGDRALATAANSLTGPKMRTGDHSNHDQLPPQHRPQPE